MSSEHRNKILAVYGEEGAKVFDDIVDHLGNVQTAEDAQVRLVEWYRKRMSGLEDAIKVECDENDHARVSVTMPAPLAIALKNIEEDSDK